MALVSAPAHTQACMFYWTSRMTVNLEDLLSVKPAGYFCVCVCQHVLSIYPFSP